MQNEIIKAELKKLEKNGKLTPFDVIEAARDKTSPLHEYFEWNDTEAARLYRIEQARGLIRTVKIEVVYEETTFRTVQYARDPASPADESRYVAVPRVKIKGFNEILQTEIAACIGHVRRVHSMASARPNDTPAGMMQGLSDCIIMLESLIE
jgi:hypothetical protein